MNIAELCVRRPVGTSLLTLGLALLGLLSLRALPVAALPQVDYPTIVVATSLPGASADTMATTVTTPLERQLAQIPGLSLVTSVSGFGSSQITLQFRLDHNIDTAEQDVQAGINAATNLLPVTLPTPPTFSKSNPADTPVITLAVTGDHVPLSVVDDFADSILAQRLSQISGVGLVSLGGGQKPAVRIRADPQALAAAGLTLEDVRQALVSANVNQPKGTLDGELQAYVVDVDDQLLGIEDYAQVVVAYRQGAPLRLSQVASVVAGVENEQLAGWAGERRAIIVNVQRQPGQNLIALSDRVRQLVPTLSASAPSGVHVEVLSDRTETIRASLQDVRFTMGFTVLLVVLVIYLFLGSLKATLIPALVVPLSMLATFAAMWGLSYSLDNLSLMALTISVGFVVDDAIVMIENIARYLEQGKSPREAAITGAKEIAFTIVSLTASLVAVLIPLLFMGGIVGRLFREFAVTLSVAIIASAALSLTLTPMLCAVWLPRVGHAPVKGGLLHYSERAIAAMLAGYASSLRVVFTYRRLTMLGLLGTIAWTAALFVTAPKGFFPLQDTGLLLGSSEAAPESSFAHMRERQVALAQALLQDEDVASVASFVGSDGVNPTSNSGRMTIALKPRTQRSRNVTQAMQHLGELGRSVAGIELRLQPVQDLQIDTRASRTQYQYTLEGADSERLYAYAARFVDTLSEAQVLTDVTSDHSEGTLSAHLSIDRDTAARLGVSIASIDDVLYDAFGQRIISTIFTQLNQYRVILEVDPDSATDPASLDRLYVPSSNGPVPLTQLTHTQLRRAPLSISHQSQFPSVTISFNVAPTAALGDAVAAIAAAEARAPAPPGVRGSLGGTALAFTESLQSQPALMLAAVVTVYIVLGLLYESYLHPITILSTLPSAGVGALLALRMCGMDFDVLALIGLVLLIGIVKKNGIMMVDFAIAAERDEGLSPSDAMFRACMLRFRPIMMTSLAAFFGGIPLAIGQGIGAELRQPLGVAIVGGLLVSQLLTLYTTPIVYLALHRLGRALAPRTDEVKTPSQPSAAAP